MQITVEEFANSSVHTYKEEGMPTITLVTLGHLPIGTQEKVEGKEILESIDRLLETHTLIRSFKIGNSKQLGSDYVWNNAEDMFNFLSDDFEDTTLNNIAVVVPYHKVRLMVSNGYSLGIDLGSINKRMMTLDLDAYRKSRVKLNPFALDSIPEELQITEDGREVNFSLVLSKTLTDNDLLRIEGKKSARVLHGINNEPTDYFVNNFVNSDFNEELITLDTLTEFCRRNKDEFIRRKIRRLVLMSDLHKNGEIVLPQDYRRVMTSQELNKQIFTLSPKYL